MREAHGLMVNYRYELKDIEKNHEAYANEGEMAASRPVQSLLKADRSRADHGKFRALPNLLGTRARLARQETE
jgi:hypothetical protein